MSLFAYANMAHFLLSRKYAAAFVPKEEGRNVTDKRPDYYTQEGPSDYS